MNLVMSEYERVDLTHWQPRELIIEARTLPLPDFLLQCEAAFMLVVVVDVGDVELATGLTASTVRRSDADGLAFQTATRELSATMSGDVVARGGMLRAGRAFAEQTSERVPLGLARSSCFVVPICKRSEVSFLHHVSLGRARNHDIVLRHRSVSKFHAWFELNSDARLFVKDCESSNHTYVNGSKVADKQEIHPGDNLRFGSVEARICTSEGLWRLFHR
jgi:hypothetical protein